MRVARPLNTKPLKSTWRDVKLDTRPRVADTILPPVCRDLLYPHVRREAWTTASVDDAMALPSRGWVVGHFAGCVARSSDCQVKLWAFSGTLGDAYPWKRLVATEINVVYAGALHLALRKRAWAVAEFVTVRAGNWIIVRPGTYYRALAGDHAAGVTVRWPSKRGSKVVVS